MTLIKNPVSWDNVFSRITVFPLLKDRNTVSEIANNIWPKTKDAILKNTTVFSEVGKINLEGELKNKKLSVSISPLKLDLTVTPKEQVDLMSFSLMTMGSYSESVKDISQLAEIWFSQEKFPQIQRLAFGLDLVSRVKSHDEAYNVISQYLPFPVDPQTSSDFRYQVNKFTTSEVVKGLNINRVSVWDALKLDLQLSIGHISQLPSKYEELYYCHLTLDINTGLEHQGELEKGKIFSLYEELESYACKISKEGII